jgi:peptidoglycan/xylan/chitin deacetylase (PgdA/CDA1 family)
MKRTMKLLYIKRNRKEGDGLGKLIPHGLMFHHFHSQKHLKGQGSISAETLDDMIQFVGRENILPAEEWYRRAISGTLKGDLCITFDDNLRCQYDVALPVLNHYGITAFWFVYTSPLQGVLERIEVYRNFRFSHFKNIKEFYQSFNKAVEQSKYQKQVEEALQLFRPEEYLQEFQFYTEEDKVFRYTRDRVLGIKSYNEIMEQMLNHHNVDVEKLRDILWMDKKQIKSLKQNGHVIGLHSHTHPTYMGRLSKQEQEDEYHTNSKILTQVLHEPPLTVSHPCNSYNQETLQILKSLGVQIGFRANMFGSYSSPYEFPREDHSNILKVMENSKNYENYNIHE